MTTTFTPGVAAAPVASAPPGPARTRLAATGLALAAVTLIGLLVTTPWGERNALGYDDIAPIRDSAWAGILADSLAFAIIGVTVGLVVLALVRSRGSVIALVGAAATMIGGLLFAIGSYAFVAFAWYATSDAVPVETGKALLSYVDQHPEHLRGPAMIGFLLFTLGSVLLCVALLRGRAAPVAAVVAFLVLTVAQFVGVEGRLLDVVQIALMLLLVGLAAWAVRVTTAGAA